MTRDDIVLKIIKHLRQWKNADINQEPYKGDSFEIFLAAFNAGMLTCKDDLNADVLTRLILIRGEDVVDDAYLCTNWDKFRTSWEEWTYAWSRVARRGLGVSAT
jgi:hypothetical protein